MQHLSRSSSLNSGSGSGNHFSHGNSPTTIPTNITTKIVPVIIFHKVGVQAGRLGRAEDTGAGSSVLRVIEDCCGGGGGDVAAGGGDDVSGEASTVTVLPAF